MVYTDDEISQDDKDPYNFTLKKTYQGTCVSWPPSKGFGFISPNGKRVEVIVHYSQIRDIGYRQLKIGNRYQFEVTPRNGGWSALNVRPL